MSSKVYNVPNKSFNLFCLKTKNENDIPINRFHKWTIYIIVLLETFIFAGCIFGWAQLVYVLKNDEIFLDLCDVNINGTLNGSEWISQEELKTQGCPEQDKEFALIYTIGCVCYGAVGVFSGLLLHHCGLVLSRFLATLSLGVGFLSLGFSSREHTFWLYISIVLLAYGGNQLRLSGLQFCNLFPKNKSTALTIISGSYAASAGLFLTFQIGQSNGLTLWSMSLSLAVLAFLSMAVTALMPWHHIPYEQTNQFKEQKVLPLRSSIFSISTITYYYWFIVLVVGLRFYTLAFNPWISRISDSNEEAGRFSYMFSISSFICPLVTPFPGMINDYFSRKAKLEGSNEKVLEKELRSPVFTLTLMIIMTIALQICMMINNPAAVYASLLILIITRPCIISVGIAFVRIRYPPEHFDRLNGICDTFVAIITPLQYPFFIWMQKSPVMAMVCFIILLVITFIHPLHLLSTSYRRKIAKERIQDYIKDKSLIVSEENGNHEKC